MSTDVIVNSAETTLSISPMQAASQTANQLAADVTFSEYIAIKSDNTIRNQLIDLKRFAIYLDAIGVEAVAASLQTLPNSWHGVEWGIVKGFVNWQLQQGYAVGSVNRALSTVKTYAKLATKAEVLSADVFAMIQMVNGYGRQAGKRIDERRDVVRVGDKKAEHTKITLAQARRLKLQPNTPQGQRDALLMCILIDLGLRVNEVELLTVEAFDMEARQVTFYRPKVDKIQTHDLSNDIYTALLAYLPHVQTAGKLWRGSERNGQLGNRSMKIRAIRKRVKHLGDQLGIWDLSPHDCRHYWATAAARMGTPIDRLQDAGGWNSVTMPMLYIEAAKVANKGVLLPE